MTIQNHSQQSEVSITIGQPLLEDALSDLAEKKEIRGDSLLCHVLFNAVNYMLGGVILSAPYVLARAGVYGFLLFFVFCFGTWTTACTLNRIFKENPKLHTYGDIAREAYGPITERILSVTQFLELFGYSASCIVTAALLMEDYVPPEYNSRSLIMTVCLVVVLPTTWCKTLRPLAALSSVGIFVFFGSVCFLIKGAWMPLSSDQEYSFSHAASIDYKQDWRDVMSSVGLVLAVFSTHAVIPELRTSMRHKEKFGTVVHGTYITCTCVWLVTAIMGYFFMFGLESPSFLITELGPPGTLTRVVVHIAYMINLYAKFPLCLVPISKITEQKMGLDAQDSIFRVILVRTGWSILALLVSILIHDFATIISLIGTLFCTLLCGVFPSLFALRLLSDLTKYERYFYIFYIIISIVLGVLNLLCMFWVGA